MVIESVPNFSEGRDRALIGELAAAAARAAHLLDVHADAVHHRVVVSVAGTDAGRLVDSLLEAVDLARRRIDLRVHAGVHPRVGAADVIPLVPLGATAMEACVAVAHELGERIWKELGLPVYFYAEAARREEARRLAGIRTRRDAPDLGGALHPTFGAVSVGARPPLIAYNLVLPDAVPRRAHELAAAIRESGGGLPGVQALAFELGSGLMQLSMNLVRLDETTPGRVLAEARRLGRELGVEIGTEEVVGLCPAFAADSAAAAGRVLEARLAAAAGDAGAARCRTLGGGERDLLAGRLEERAGGLRELGVQGDALLRGAEEAAALPRVLEQAGALEDDVRELFEVARAGLRAGVTPAVAEAYAARVEALDRWVSPPR